jgi:hypothetical protein
MWLLGQDDHIEFHNSESLKTCIIFASVFMLSRLNKEKSPEGKFLIPCFTLHRNIS